MKLDAELEQSELEEKKTLPVEKDKVQGVSTCIDESSIISKKPKDELLITDLLGTVNSSEGEALCTSPDTAQTSSSEDNYEFSPSQHLREKVEALDSTVWRDYESNIQDDMYKSEHMDSAAGDSHTVEKEIDEIDEKPSSEIIDATEGLKGEREALGDNECVAIATEKDLETTGEIMKPRDDELVGNEHLDTQENFSNEETCNSTSHESSLSTEITNQVSEENFSKEDSKEKDENEQDGEEREEHREVLESLADNELGESIRDKEDRSRDVETDDNLIEEKIEDSEIRPEGDLQTKNVAHDINLDHENIAQGDDMLDKASTNDPDESKQDNIIEDAKESEKNCESDKTETILDAEASFHTNDVHEGDDSVSEQQLAHNLPSVDTVENSERMNDEGALEPGEKFDATGDRLEGSREVISEECGDGEGVVHAEGEMFEEKSLDTEVVPQDDDKLQSVNDDESLKAVHDYQNTPSNNAGEAEYENKKVNEDACDNLVAEPGKFSGIDSGDVIPETIVEQSLGTEVTSQILPDVEISDDPISTKEESADPLVQANDWKKEIQEDEGAVEEAIQIDIHDIQVKDEMLDKPSEIATGENSLRQAVDPPDHQQDGVLSTVSSHEEPIEMNNFDEENGLKAEEISEERIQEDEIKEIDVSENEEHKKNQETEQDYIHTKPVVDTSIAESVQDQELSSRDIKTTDEFTTEQKVDENLVVPHEQESIEDDELTRHAPELPNADTEKNCDQTSNAGTSGPGEKSEEMTDKLEDDTEGTSASETTESVNIVDNNSNDESSDKIHEHQNTVSENISMEGEERTKKETEDEVNSYENVAAKPGMFSSEDPNDAIPDSINEIKEDLETANQDGDISRDLFGTNEETANPVSETFDTKKNDMQGTEELEEGNEENMKKDELDRTNDLVTDEKEKGNINVEISPSEDEPVEAPLMNTDNKQDESQSNEEENELRGTGISDEGIQETESDEIKNVISEIDEYKNDEEKVQDHSHDLSILDTPVGETEQGETASRDIEIDSIQIERVEDESSNDPNAQVENETKSKAEGANAEGLEEIRKRQQNEMPSESIATDIAEVVQEQKDELEREENVENDEKEICSASDKAEGLSVVEASTGINETNKGDDLISAEASEQQHAPELLSADSKNDTEHLCNEEDSGPEEKFEETSKELDGYSKDISVQGKATENVMVSEKEMLQESTVNTGDVSQDKDENNNEEDAEEIHEHQVSTEADISIGGTEQETEAHDMNIDCRDMNREDTMVTENVSSEEPELVQVQKDKLEQDSLDDANIIQKDSEKGETEVVGDTGASANETKNDDDSTPAEVAKQQHALVPSTVDSEVNSHQMGHEGVPGPEEKSEETSDEPEHYDVSISEGKVTDSVNIVDREMIEENSVNVFNGTAEEIHDHQTTVSNDISMEDKEETKKADDDSVYVHSSENIVENSGELHNEDTEDAIFDNIKDVKEDLDGTSTHMHDTEEATSAPSDETCDANNDDVQKTEEFEQANEEVTEKDEHDIQVEQEAYNAPNDLVTDEELGNINMEKIIPIDDQPVEAPIVNSNNEQTEISTGISEEGIQENEPEETQKSISENDEQINMQGKVQDHSQEFPIHDASDGETKQEQELSSRNVEIGSTLIEQVEDETSDAPNTQGNNEENSKTEEATSEDLQEITEARDFDFTNEEKGQQDDMPTDRITADIAEVVEVQKDELEHQENAEDADVMEKHNENDETEGIYDAEASTGRNETNESDDLTSTEASEQQNAPGQSSVDSKNDTDQLRDEGNSVPGEKHEETCNELDGPSETISTEGNERLSTDKETGISEEGIQENEPEDTQKCISENSEQKNTQEKEQDRSQELPIHNASDGETKQEQELSSINVEIGNTLIEQVEDESSDAPNTQGNNKENSMTEEATSEDLQELTEARDFDITNEEKGQQDDIPSDRITTDIAEVVEVQRDELEHEENVEGADIIEKHHEKDGTEGIYDEEASTGKTETNESEDLTLTEVSEQQNAPGESPVDSKNDTEQLRVEGNSVPGKKLEETSNKLDGPSVTTPTERDVNESVIASEEETIYNHNDEVAKETHEYQEISISKNIDEKAEDENKKANDVSGDHSNTEEVTADPTNTTCVSENENTQELAELEGTNEKTIESNEHDIQVKEQAVESTGDPVTNEEESMGDIVGENVSSDCQVSEAETVINSSEKEIQINFEEEKEAKPHPEESVQENESEEILNENSKIDEPRNEEDQEVTSINMVDQLDDSAPNSQITNETNSNTEATKAEELTEVTDIHNTDFSHQETSRQEILSEKAVANEAEEEQVHKGESEQEDIVANADDVEIPLETIKTGVPDAVESTGKNEIDEGDRICSTEASQQQHEPALPSSKMDTGEKDSVSEEQIEMADKQEGLYNAISTGQITEIVTVAEGDMIQERSINMESSLEDDDKVYSNNDETVESEHELLSTEAKNISNETENVNEKTDEDSQELPISDVFHAEPEQFSSQETINAEPSNINEHTEKEVETGEDEKVSETLSVIKNQESTASDEGSNTTKSADAFNPEELTSDSVSQIYDSWSANNQESSEIENPDKNAVVSSVDDVQVKEERTETADEMVKNEVSSDKEITTKESDKEEIYQATADDNIDNNAFEEQKESDVSILKSVHEVHNYSSEDTIAQISTDKKNPEDASLVLDTEELMDSKTDDNIEANRHEKSDFEKHDDTQDLTSHDQSKNEEPNTQIEEINNKTNDESTTGVNQEELNAISEAASESHQTEERKDEKNYSTMKDDNEGQKTEATYVSDKDDDRVNLDYKETEEVSVFDCEASSAKLVENQIEQGTMVNQPASNENLIQETSSNLKTVESKFEEITDTVNEKESSKDEMPVAYTEEPVISSVHNVENQGGACATTSDELINDIEIVSLDKSSGTEECSQIEEKNVEEKISEASVEALDRGSSETGKDNQEYQDYLPVSRYLMDHILQKDGQDLDKDHNVGSEEISGKETFSDEFYKNSKSEEESDLNSSTVVQVMQDPSSSEEKGLQPGDPDLHKNKEHELTSSESNLHEEPLSSLSKDFKDEVPIPSTKVEAERAEIPENYSITDIGNAEKLDHVHVDQVSSSASQMSTERTTQEDDGELKEPTDVSLVSKASEETILSTEGREEGLETREIVGDNSKAPPNSVTDEHKKLINPTERCLPFGEDLKNQSQCSENEQPAIVSSAKDSNAELSDLSSYLSSEPLNTETIIPPEDSTQSDHEQEKSSLDDTEKMTKVILQEDTGIPNKETNVLSVSETFEKNPSSKESAEALKTEEVVEFLHENSSDTSTEKTPLTHGDAEALKPPESETNAPDEATMSPSESQKIDERIAESKITAKKNLNEELKPCDESSVAELDEPLNTETVIPPEDSTQSHHEQEKSSLDDTEKMTKVMLQEETGIPNKETNVLSVSETSAKNTSSKESEEALKTAEAVELVHDKSSDTSTHGDAEALKPTESETNAPDQATMSQSESQKLDERIAESEISVKKNLDEELKPRDGSSTAELDERHSKAKDLTFELVQKPGAKDELKDDDKDENEHEMEADTHHLEETKDVKDADTKSSHKKSHNILSGVGSKVKHSIAKVKKAIIGKSKAESPK